MGLIRSVHEIRDRSVKEKVHVPEWGDEDSYVYVRGLSGREYERWQLSLMSQQKGESPRATLDRLKNSNARLAVLGSCDENGEPIFSDSDIPYLMDRSNKALNRVATAIQRLSGIGVEDEVIEEFEGNSEAGQSSSSASGSPAISVAP